MKKLFSLVTIVLLVLISSTSFSQLTKEESKEWKKRAKEMAKDPESLKTLVESEAALQSQVSTLKNEQDALKSQLNAKDAKIDEMEGNLTQLRAELSDARSTISEMESNMPQVAASEGAIPGVVFKVQIGAFRNKDLSKYFDNHPNFAGEIVDGTQKITIGQFSDYWEADTFKKYLREMGVKDAWIVPYKDGVRVPIKDVLEGVVSE
ncbi:Ezrin/radixin/moesin family protein [Fulvivirga sedimenti]|uniref:Ezrin/radixin/moesin family protein n=1 Tax=Fulvivirga sedimenti TaxID=2879465 RepID=A0A9X1L159_9BACT|nr:Ezrin/radixin/moesin family protein [Fulvivirga sedimenti]MCA6078604.1 Ezrin/radixin/moesin family protein [Fulvivirga sedimenti]